jgi:hypothetical protein
MRPLDPSGNPYLGLLGHLASDPDTRPAARERITLGTKNGQKHGE